EMWATVLGAMTSLAGGWLLLGRADQAAPILAEVRDELTGPNALPLSGKDYVPLAQAYVAALGNGPVDSRLSGIMELFRHMDPGRVTNSFTTAKFFSRFHLNLAEEAVFAACRLLGGAEVWPVVV